MRKFMTGVAAMAVVLSLGSMTALAAEQVQVYDASNGGCAYCGASCEFVDADGDGICDNYASAGCGYCGASCQFVDADGDGICDNYVSGNCGYCGASCQFVDADGDGICDNYASRNYCGRGYGSGQGRRHGRGRHCR